MLKLGKQASCTKIKVLLFIPRCYNTTFSSGGCFCAFEILVALATKQYLVAVVYTGSLRHNHGKYNNNGKDGYFRFDDDNNMSYRYSISITFIEMGQLNTYNPIYCIENKKVIDRTSGMLDTPPQGTLQTFRCVQCLWVVLDNYDNGRQ